MLVLNFSALVANDEQVNPSIGLAANLALLTAIIRRSSSGSRAGAVPTGSG